MRSLDRWRPLLIIGVMLAWVVLGVSCLGCATVRDNAVAVLNASSDFGATAEAALTTTDHEAQQACLDHAGGVHAADDARACVDGVRARFRPAWTAYRAYRAAYLAAAAEARAYDDAARLSRKPDPARLLALAGDLLKAERAFADAVAAVKVP